MSMWIITGKQRKLWVDGLRGIAMLLVLYGHLVQGATLYFAFTSPLKIPLFFAVTGYVFSAEEQQSLFFKKLLKGIIIPWLCLSLIYILISGVVKGTSYMYESAVDILIGKSIWYMPCIIVGEIIWFFTRKYFSKTWSIGLAAVICSAVGFYLAKKGFLDFFMINRALHIQVYLFLGYLFKKAENKKCIEGIKGWQIICLGIVYVTLCAMSFFVLFPNRAFDVHKVSYYNIPYCMLLILIGCAFMFLAGKRVGNLGVALTFVGQNTLVYYILGGSCTRIADKVIRRFLSMLHLSITSVYIVPVFDIIVGCLMAACITIILARSLPFTVGKKSIGKFKTA